MRMLTRSLPAPPARLLAVTAVLLTACRHAGGAAVAARPQTPAACGVVAAPAMSSRASEPAGDAVAVFDSAWTIIRRTHWDSTYNGVNWTAVRDELRPRAAAARTRGELRAVLADMVSRLRQSHFALIPQEVADATGGSSGRSARSGGSLGLDVRLLAREMVVTAVDTGGPAWTAGVRTGWVVDAIAGCPVAAKLAVLPSHEDARATSLDAYRATMQALAGAEGDSLRVQFRDGRDALRPLSLVFGAAPGTVTRFGNLPPMAAHLSWQRVRQDGRTIGIIRFNIWMPVLAAQFDAAVDSLRQSDAIVLDVRGNFGGVGGMSTGIAGHFLDTAVAIGTMHQRGGTTHFLANPRRVDTRQQRVSPFSGPLAIVVDELSVSTTEIFAGGLKAVGRATIFGTQSAGQALPATPERLANGDILYHAIADFISPNGKPVEGEGVLPDRVTPPDRRSLLNGRDVALSAALQWAAQQAPRRPTP
jgi:carboxyl-terminal processing protease